MTAYGLGMEYFNFYYLKKEKKKKKTVLDSVFNSQLQYF